MQPPTSIEWYARDLASIAGELDTDEAGLSEDEAARRLEAHGPNRIEEAPPPPAFTVLLRQFASPVIFILGIACAVTLALGEYIDAGVIAAVLALNASIGFLQERQAERSVRALMVLLSPHARVLRGGREWEVDSATVVPGDVVLLESGVKVPADVRLFSAVGLSVDESLLTGESEPVAKHAGDIDGQIVVADRANIAHAGSIVTRGRGRGWVVSTGMATELGRIADEVRRSAAPRTPLQVRLNRLARTIALAVAVAAATSFVLGVALGESASEMFVVAVALSVAVVPEGLPIAFTITFARGVRQMASRNAIVRRLAAVETLGSTTVIGSDKTGTLTENRMTVRSIYAGGQYFEGDRHAGLDHPGGIDLAEHRPLYLTLLAGALANEADAFRTESGIESQGDPTEVALLASAMAWGIEPSEARERYAPVDERPFEPEQRYSATLRLHDETLLQFVKGAPERVVGMCDLVAVDGHGAEPIDRGALVAVADEMAGQGLRVLGMAYRELPARAEFDEEPAGLTFLGFQGSLDPPREAVADAIAACHAAGIRVVMITGDHAVTAGAIAREIGIPARRETVLTGAALAEMSADELLHNLRSANVFARVAPEQKLLIVERLREAGEVVAVTGDGVNDAPALRAADIGVAMGRGGTDVAREAADMVLADDNFTSIEAAVEEGRITFDNIRKVTFFLVSTGAATAVTITAAIALGWPVPLVAAQLLWLNLVTNGLQDIALAFEPGEPGLMRRRPRPRAEGILSRVLWERVGITGVVAGVGALVLFRYELDASGSLERAQTAALTTMVLFQMFQVGNARSETLSVLRKSPFSNPFLFAATAAALGVHVLSLHVPPTQYVLRVEPLGLDAWVRAGLVASTLIVVMEAHKLLRGGRAAYWPSGRHAS
ncbi:MAG: cation-translocating P-type ATPase [Dehalococcoidia bacterium]